MIVNLTPHTVTVFSGETPVLVLESTGVARAAQHDEACEPVEGIPTVRSVFGAVENLPEPQPGTWFVVSIITANAARAANRSTDDLLVTSNPVRDAEGRIIGCRAFARV